MEDELPVPAAERPGDGDEHPESERADELDAGEVDHRPRAPGTDRPGEPGLDRVDAGAVEPADQADLHHTVFLGDVHLHRHGSWRPTPDSVEAHREHREVIVEGTLPGTALDLL